MLTSNKNIGLNSKEFLYPSENIPEQYIRTYSQYGPEIIPSDSYHLGLISLYADVPHGVKYFNSFSYASDEFETDHTEEHILFLGCSNTQGSNFPDKYLWAKKLKNDLFPKSNFFNLSLAGGASEEIIYNAITYIKKYGKPKNIFFLMPNFGRGLARNLSISRLKTIQMYSIFEMYCLEANINLFSMTWDYSPSSENVNNLMPELFKTFYKVDVDKLTNMVYDIYTQDPKNELMLKWDDQNHFGIAQHEAYYRIFKDIYLEKTRV